MGNRRDVHFSVIVIGAGVTGAAAAYQLLTRTSLPGDDVLVLEASSSPGTVNSDAASNSQTLHMGDIETNYSLQQALRVKGHAQMLQDYIRSKDDPKLALACQKMVLGVGWHEVQILTERFKLFREHYPHLKLVFGDGIGSYEPYVMAGRDVHTPVAALVSDDGLMVNYQKLAEHLMCDVIKANARVMYNTAVTRIIKIENGYRVVTATGQVFTADSLVCGAGAYSLYFAHMLGHGTGYSLLSVAGSYYEVKNCYLGKVYRVQKEGLPFAAVHGDPDITDPGVVRFGPTTKPIPLMVRHRYDTMYDYLALFGKSAHKGVASLLKILYKRKLLSYVITNLLYDVPFLGPRMFLTQARSIVPSLTARDIHLKKGAGGVRPQLIDLRTQDLVMGAATIYGEAAIFNTSPSPGASVCMGNGYEYAKWIAERIRCSFVP